MKKVPILTKEETIMKRNNSIFIVAIILAIFLAIGVISSFVSLNDTLANIIEIGEVLGSSHQYVINFQEMFAYVGVETIFIIALLGLILSTFSISTKVIKENTNIKLLKKQKNVLFINLGVYIVFVIFEIIVLARINTLLGEMGLETETAINAILFLFIRLALYGALCFDAYKVKKLASEGNPDSNDIFDEQKGI